MRGGPNQVRRQDIEAALKRAKVDDYLRLEELAIVWGVVKTRFVNVKALIADFPQPVQGPQNSHLYPAIPALKAMLAYEMRNDALKSDLEARAARILGRGPKRGRRKREEAMLPINEMATLSRVMAETEQRERDQGLYAPLAGVAATAGRVFSMISGYLSELDAHIDPNGLLPIDVRALIRAGGRDVSLQIAGEMKDMLSGDASPKPRSSQGRRSADGRAGRASARRKRSGRVAIQG